MSVVPFYIYGVPVDGVAQIVRSGKREDSAESWSKIPLKEGHTLVKLELVPGVFIPKPGIHKVNIQTKEFSEIEQPVVLPVNEKIKELNEACVDTITGGFRSNALNPDGDHSKSYFYPSDITSQLNLLHGSPITCCDNDNVWAKRDHTDKQLEIVRNTFKSLRDTCRTRLDALVAEARSATTLEELAALKWVLNDK